MNDFMTIAEMSGNHNHSLQRALDIVDAAADAGVSALKLQTYTADTMTIDSDRPEFRIEDHDSLWNGETLHHLYQNAYTPWEWHEPIFKRCQERGLIGFSTPFDITAVDFLENLNVPMYKVAAFENGDIPLLKKIASTGKPVIMSIGMIGPNEISEALTVLKENGCPEITLLKCTSVYPASPNICNLRTILDLKKRFPQCRIGLSDHTQGIGVAIAAVALGADVIEKHFTLNRSDGGVDAAFSIDPFEMKMLIDECKVAHVALGKISYQLSEQEKKSFLLRRSIYAVKDIRAGESFTKDNIRCIRPGYGLHPRYFESLLGKKSARTYLRGTPLTFQTCKDLISEDKEAKK